MATITREWEGLDTLQAMLRQAPANSDKWLRNEIMDAANEAFNESQRQVPVRYGVLRGSGNVEVVSESPFTVVIGYGGEAASYALWVHENLMAHHKPPTKAKYLEDPVNAVSRTMDSHMQESVDGVILGHYPQAPSIAMAQEAGGVVATAMRSRRRGVPRRPMSHAEIGAALAAIDRGSTVMHRHRRGG